MILEEQYTDNYLITDDYFALKANPQKEIRLTELELIVSDSENNRPISKAMISIDAIGFTSVCDDNGVARVKKILTGYYLIDVIMPGYIASSSYVMLTSGHPNRLRVQMIRNC